MKENYKRNLKETLIKYPIVSSLFVSVVIGFIILMIASLLSSLGYKYIVSNTFHNLDSIILFSPFFVFPFVLTALNIVFLCEKKKSVRRIHVGKKIEAATFIVGIIYASILLSFQEVYFDIDWTEQLANSQMHTPIATWTMPTFFTITLVAVFGYIVLRLMPLNKLPPLITVCAIGCMYLGVALSILFIIQLFGSKVFIVCLLPFNYIIITAKVIRELIIQWNRLNLEPESKEKYSGNKLMQRFNSMLSKAAYWPLAGFLIMWPILGILTVILVLFGQEPDSIIKAFTETSDWNLSQRVAPQNIYYDEHYLCTVAAGGHKRVVKPLRLGMRHGHEVVVNRQLCIANAFEQILEKKTPKLHSKIRHFYDKYGYPIARHIRSPFAADAIYFVMKPLEWFFLIVIYICDSKPENRIAVQYLPKE